MKKFLSIIFKKKIGKYLIDKAFEDKAKYIPLKRLFSRMFRVYEKISKSLYFEFGVGDGGSARIISEFFSENKFMVLIVLRVLKMNLQKIHFGNLIKKFLKKVKHPSYQNYVLIKGYLEETFDAFIKKKKLYEVDTLLIHFDMDVYEPTKLILNFIRKSKKKTIIMFDEFYNYEEFEKHEWRAFMKKFYVRILKTRCYFTQIALQKNFGHLSKFCFEIN